MILHTKKMDQKSETAGKRGSAGGYMTINKILSTFIIPKPLFILLE
jgi:hypothetical protein